MGYTNHSGQEKSLTRGTLYLSALRPMQWAKNVLVAAAPLAAGLIFDSYKKVFLGVIAFTFASSFGYLLNDWQDKERDAKHPTKRRRPFASKELREKDLFLLILFCSSMSILTSFSLPLYFVLSLITYVAVTISYTLFIKKIAVLEMIWLSLGFLIRALAGSALIHEKPTGWFITAVFFGAMFVVSNKRAAELKKGDGTRSVLNLYSQDFLRQVSTISAAITVLTYCLWVFQIHPESVFAQLSILSVTFSIFIYLHQTDYDNAEKPEQILLLNPYLRFSAISTLILLSLVFYL